MEYPNNFPDTKGQSRRYYTFVYSIVCILMFTLCSSQVQALNSGIENLRETGKAFASVAKKVSPAVVFIQVEKLTQNQPSMQFSTPFGNENPFSDEFFRYFFV